MEEKITPSTESIQSIHSLTGDTECILLQDKVGLVALWKNTATGWTKCWSFQVPYIGFCQCRILDDTLITPLSSGAIQLSSLSCGEKQEEIKLWDKEKSGEVS